MKIAFDEHVPRDIAKALRALSGEEKLLRVQIVSARDYAPPRSESDVPWLEKFAKAGGKVVVSGDKKMRGRLHEQRALSAAGFVVFFMAPGWNRRRSYEKFAMIVRWWPLMLEKIASAKPGQFFEVPDSFTSNDMREVTPPGTRRKPGKRPRDVTP